MRDRTARIAKPKPFWEISPAVVVVLLSVTAGERTFAADDFESHVAGHRLRAHALETG